MNRVSKNNVIIYMLISVLFILNIVLFSILIFTTQNNSKNYEQSVVDDKKIIERINFMEEKLNLEYNAETGKYK